MALDLPEVNIEQELAAAEKADAEAPAPADNQDAPEDRGAAFVEKTEDEGASAAADEKPAAEEEEKTDEQPAQKQEKRGDPTVALRIARKEAKELKERLRVQEASQIEKIRQLEARINAIQNPPPPPPVKPDFETDPIGNLQAELAETKASNQQIIAETNAAKLDRHINTSLQNAESSFAAEHPDYNDASRYLAEVMSKNLEVLGIPEAERVARMTNEVKALTVHALRSGRNPAEIIYGMAQNQGYRPKSAAAPASAQATDASAKLDSVAKGQGMAQTLGSGGRADAGKLTLDSLSRMDDDDFNALVQDESKWKQVMQLMH